MLQLGSSRPTGILERCGGIDILPPHRDVEYVWVPVVVCAGLESRAFDLLRDGIRVCDSHVAGEFVDVGTLLLDHRHLALGEYDLRAVSLVKNAHRLIT